ncbi:hypothetical protein DLAC_06713 [Tieghemostelium lacteum]|uniref:Chitin-binding type-4 domain-containing protein n=1 Tax=Tieghemostelium lacteum TaxID=361077 RepID=A0A151ZFM1_TIELA|nr:hypothetical protein DLAC_06713 [Tieghemostelium lacteum]|eukprot:KYQ92709.1 hypothetical protein DLAC_06713 [Tieghemostelium lacteum]
MLKLSLFILSLLLINIVNSHSFMSCVNFDFEKNECAAYPRNWRFQTVQGDGYLYQRGKFTKPGPTPLGQACGPAQTRLNPVTNQYSQKYPMGQFHQGQKISPQWPARNHATQPRAGTVSFYLSRKMTFDDLSDNTQDEFFQHQISSNPFGNCTKYYENTNNATCTATITIPDVEDGLYTLQWFWEFNPQEYYMTCADIYISKNVNPNLWSLNDNRQVNQQQETHQEERHQEEKHQHQQEHQSEYQREREQQEEYEKQRQRQQAEIDKSKQQQQERQRQLQKEYAEKQKSKSSDLVNEQQQSVNSINQLSSNGRQILYGNGQFGNFMKNRSYGKHSNRLLGNKQVREFVANGDNVLFLYCQNAGCLGKSKYSRIEFDLDGNAYDPSKLIFKLYTPDLKEEVSKVYVQGNKLILNLLESKSDKYNGFMVTSRDYRNQIPFTFSEISLVE